MYYCVVYCVVDYNINGRSQPILDITGGERLIRTRLIRTRLIRTRLIRTRLIRSST